MTESETLASSGIAGLDEILHGGFIRNRLYLVSGGAGAGKTTLGMQFAMAGAEAGEPTLYITTAESELEINAIARSHGWSLDGVAIHHHADPDVLQPGGEQTIFHPAEYDLPKTIESLLVVVDRAKPARLVIDSLSEIRTLARNEAWYRRQLLFLREHFLRNRCTVLLLDDAYAAGLQPAQSVVSGIIDLERYSPEYGPDRRRLHIRKLRGATYQGGYHDFRIRRGGIFVFPRLVAAERRHRFEPAQLPTGLPELDQLLAGGLDKGSNVVLIGPAGAGKSLTATQCVAAAAERGERSAVYLFDENEHILLQRARGVGLDLKRYIEDGVVMVQEVNPAEMTPGEFSQAVRRAITEHEVRLVLIDSLNGYMQAMPEERLLIVHLHELLAYLNQREVTPLVVVAQHGLPGSALHAPIDVSYIADTVLLFRHFEYAGEVRKAVSVYKRRAGPHENTIRELRVSRRRLQVGEPLKEFQGVLTGQPTFIGDIIHDPERSPSRRRPA